MALAAYNAFARTDSGSVIPSAALEVRTRNANGTSGSLATIYSDAAGTTPISQPWTADADGSFGFYVATGQYNILVGSGASQITFQVDITRGDGGFSTLTVTGTATFSGAATFSAAATFTGNTTYTASGFSYNRAGLSGNAYMVFRADDGFAFGIRGYDNDSALNRSVLVNNGADVIQIGATGWAGQEMLGDWSASGTFTVSDGFFNADYSTNAVTSRITNTNASFSSDVFRLRASRSGNSAYNFARFQSNVDVSADTEFLFSGDGNGTCDGSWTGGGADYAELFEWADGNPFAEDRRGISVVLDGEKIKAAEAGEEPIGVISAMPAVLGDGDVDRWKGKYLRDDFGAYVMEQYQLVTWIEQVEVGEAVSKLDEETGEEVEFIETRTRGEERSYDAGALPDGVSIPEGATFSDATRRKINPEYDDSLVYIPRKDRKEWSAVGLVGKLRIRKGQPTGSRWIKMRDVSADVEEWLVR